jgi:hypothetical protein
MGSIVVIAALVGLAACQPPTQPTSTDTAPTPEEPTLPTPFSADEIRAGWTEGLQLTILQTSPQGSEKQRWTVVEWSEEGCAIEYAVLDADGAISGEPMVQQATWNELRDHALFPSDRATRIETTRETPMGAFGGWLYETTDPVSGGVSRYFFAHDLAGAPLWVENAVNGEVVATMEQIARSDLQIDGLD